MAHILLVEDNPTNLKLARLILESAGHRVRSFGNATEAIDAVVLDAPDLILMDIQLPDLDGLAATKILKANPATETIPVVALTAFAMNDDAKRIRDAGCDSYLAKPYRRAALLEAVAALLKRHT